MKKCLDAEYRATIVDGKATGETLVAPQVGRIVQLTASDVPQTIMAENRVVYHNTRPALGTLTVVPTHERLLEHLKHACHPDASDPERWSEAVKFLCAEIDRIQLAGVR